MVASDGNIMSTHENYTNDENRDNIHGGTDSVVLRNILEMRVGDENLRESIIDGRSSISEIDAPFS